jgi:hypothetical protein
MNRVVSLALGRASNTDARKRRLPSTAPSHFWISRIKEKDNTRVQRFRIISTASNEAGGSVLAVFVSER